MLPVVRTVLIAVVTGIWLVPAPCLAQSAGADKSPLSLRIEPIATSPRSYSPILIEITLDPRVEQLMEGTLHLKFSEASSMKLLEVRIPDIVVANTEYTTTLLLPPFPTPNVKVVDVNAKFVTATEEFPLGAPGKNSAESYLSLLVTPAVQRATVIGMLIDEVEDPTAAAFTFLNKALALDQYADQPMYWAPDLRGQFQLKKMKYGWFACSSVIVKPDTLPAEPLALCAFDVVVVSDGGLNKLDQGRMDAMVKWVRAGGSLCVVPDGAIERRHTNFLADLMAEHPNPPAMTRDKSGGFVAGWEGMHVQSKLGLGRVVLLTPNKSLREGLDEVKAPALAQQIAGFLWKVRGSQVGKEKWQIPAPPKPGSTGMGVGGNVYRQAAALGAYQEGLETATVRPLESSTVAQQLMPSNVRMVPLSLVAMMLLAYVFIVGPGDYLLLGMLKMRRYTWIVFPIVTALFTMGMVGVSNHYMSTTENGGKIEINDVVGSGQIVRRTGIDLDFFGAQRDVHDDRSAQLITQMDMRTGIHDLQVQYQMARAGVIPYSTARQPAAFSGDSSGLYFEGRVPGRYATHKTVRQWEPQLSRTFEIVSEAAPNCGFDWGNPGAIWTAAGRQKLTQAITKHNPDIGAVVLNSNGSASLRPLPYPPAIRQQFEVGGVYQAGYAADYSSDYLTLISQMSDRSLHFFRYVSAISPNGANNFEDLAMLDNTDDRQWLLIVSWFEDGTQKVYRRLYHQPPEPDEPPGPNDPFSDSNDPFPEVNVENDK